MVLVGAFRRIFPTVEKFAKLPLRQKVRDGRGLAEVFAQVGVTNFVMDPFFCLPSFYLCKEVASWLDKRGLPQDSGQGLQRDLDEDVAPSPRVGGEIGEGRGEEGGKGLPMYARVMKSWYRNVREDASLCAVMLLIVPFWKLTTILLPSRDRWLHLGRYGFRRRRSTSASLLCTFACPS